jgi:hypothetical protein
VAIGHAVVHPAALCFTMLQGAHAAWLLERRFPSLAARVTIAPPARQVAGARRVGVAL